MSPRGWSQSHTRGSVGSSSPGLRTWKTKNSRVRNLPESQVVIQNFSTDTHRLEITPLPRVPLKLFSRESQKILKSSLTSCRWKASAAVQPKLAVRCFVSTAGCSALCILQNSCHGLPESQRQRNV